MVTIFLVFLIGSLLVLARFLYKEWLYPLSLQKVMNSQGIRGPPYKFPDGNVNEIRDMEMKSNTGNMELSHDILPRLQPHFQIWNKLYGSTFLFWRGTKPQLLVADVDLIREILSNKEGSFGQRKLEGSLDDLFGNGLPFSEGQKWSQLRKVAEYAFHGQSLKGMTSAMIGTVEEMLKKWKSYEGKEMDVYEEVKLMSSEIISKNAFGSSYEEGKQIFEMVDRLVHLIFMGMAKTRIPGIDKLFKTSLDRESDNLRQALRDSIMLLIKKREDNVKAGLTDSYGSDFLGSLLKAHHDTDDKTGIPLDDIIDECKTFYFAGHEPTTIVLGWTILLLAIHTDWQEKVRKEVLELFGQDNPNTDIISRLKIMGMIINESLRLYPPAVYIMRKSTKTRLGKFTLPAGLEVNIPPLLLRSSSELWGEDTHLFKPERFAEGVTKLTREQLNAYLPFGFGPRKCVGSNFAMMEIKIALSMILQRYKFTLSPNYKHSPVVILNLQPTQGIQIMLHPL